MLLRLLLTLILALPMPAMAACHVPKAAPMAMAVHMNHAPAKPDPVRQMPVEALCIGCIAPATVRAPMLAAPLAHGLVLAAPMRLSGEPIAAPAPDTPPPRSEA